ncbi:MAG: glycine--tRNA ligase [Kiritimatiellae bacterium]|nr:glycine--tRNA ligase [Kiritimatiellia bacterium]
MANTSMDVISSLCKRRGFIYHSSEIYGGINGFWDYGPFGCEMKRNIKNAWWEFTVRTREDVVGLDATIIMHPSIWKASGHLSTFSDPMCTCRSCKKLMRADQVADIFTDGECGKSLAEVVKDGVDAAKVAGWCKGKAKGIAKTLAAVADADKLTAAFNAMKADPAKYADLYALYTLLAAPETEGYRACPYCGGELTEPRPFNLMFKTVVGPVDDPDNVAYLRPETAQAIFAEFTNILNSSRVSVPFGIAQMGKSFRNEVTPRNYTFRSREFEQMELEFFIKPDEAVELVCGHVVTMKDNPDLSTPAKDWGWEVWHKYWVEQRKAWIHRCGLPAASFTEYWQKPDELAHYARACVDIEYQFPFGLQELEGIAARSDYDLTQHQIHSGQSMEVFDADVKAAAAALDDAAKAAFTEKVVADWTARGKDPEKAKKFLASLFEGRYIPHVIEPSAGVDRMMLALLCNAYEEQKLTDNKGKDDSRVVMHFSPVVAPVKVGVFPIVKNKPDVYEKAREIYKDLRKRVSAFWDESGQIGRRYRRQDEIGTPWCITVDFQTLEDGTFTVRDRDTMQQTRMTLPEFKAMMEEALLM